MLMTPNEIKRLDTIFSHYIHTRADGRCENCGKYTDTIQTSHVLGRRNLGARWHEYGAFGDCNDCHRLVENMTKGEKEYFYKTRLGLKPYYEIRGLADKKNVLTPKQVSEMILQYSKTKI